MNASTFQSLESLESVIDRLTAPDGCPWDREQTPLSLCDYLIEESHELVSAIRSGDREGFREELGDVFFLLLFLARLGEKNEDFSLGDVLDLAARKMVRRHPHVFGDVKFANLDEQLKAWESIKKKEHEDKGLFAGLPDSLPPLVKAYRIHSRAARVGFTWPDAEEVEQQVESEWLEWLDAREKDDKEAKRHELGDLLFSLVELGRRHGIKASEALDVATRRFLSRFRRMEELAAQAGKELAALDLNAQDELWLKAKEEESAGHA